MSDWRHEAACLGLVEPDDDPWYPQGKWGQANESRLAYAVAARVCQRCPVQAECLSAALAEEGPASASNRYGMRGGLTPGQRRSVYEGRVDAERLAGLARRLEDVS